MNPKKDTRKLKVYTKYCFSKHGNSKVQPEIRLKGEWLKSLGYNCGDQVTVNYFSGGLIIRNLKIELPIITL